MAEKRVRQTVDLSREQDAAFVAWRLDAALNLGRRRVTTQDTLVALVDVLLADEEVSRKVLARLDEME
jgi:hypothetical protein